MTCLDIMKLLNNFYSTFRQGLDKCLHVCPQNSKSINYCTKSRTYSFKVEESCFKLKRVVESKKH